jgi:aldose 1-epimerase
MIICGLAGLSLFSACSRPEHPGTALIPPAENFDHQVDGKQVKLFILENKKGMKAAITNYGGRLVSLIVPDRDAKPVSVVAGFDALDGYINSTEPYFGATIGRYGNRIANGRFKLDGKEYQLSVNNGPNTLHGGKRGFQYQVFDAEQQGDTSLVLSLHSPDQDNGFPGSLSVKVTYTLTSLNELKLNYEATTDKETVVNLTNHAFFNLNGEGSGKITGHILTIAADKYTPVDSVLIPNGQILPVKGTPFDFVKGTAIGVRINDHNEQLHFGKGYDHNFVLNPHPPRTPVAKVWGEKSGIQMRVMTSEPGLQFYSGNFMQSKNKMRAGNDDFRTAFCLETQHFPDSPNHPAFPSVILKPGELYSSQTCYSFSAQ